MAKSITVLSKEYRRAWQDVNKHFDSAELFWKNTVTHMKLLGDALNRAKEQTEHGDWANALAEHCPRISEKWAREAMRISREWDRVEQIAEHEDTIKGVLAKLKKPKEPKQESGKTELSSDLDLAKTDQDTPKNAEKLPPDTEPAGDFDGWNEEEAADEDVIEATPVDPSERIKELWDVLDYAEQYPSGACLCCGAKAKAPKNKTRKRFKPPTLEEVAGYCEEKGYDVDPEHFVAYYESQGWRKANGQKVTSWKGCVVTFSKNGQHKQSAKEQFLARFK